MAPAGEMLAVGIIGLGEVSRFYVEAIDGADDLELVAVCDSSPDRLEPFMPREGLVTFEDAAELFEDRRVDAVVLDTPVATHPELARAALAAGVHVCCEKPLALTSADAGELAELAARSERVLFTAFHRRYNANLPAPASLEQEGLAAVEVRYLEMIEDHSNADSSWYARPAADGGGCIVDNGPNAVDVVHHLFGRVGVDDVDVERSADGVDLRAVIHGALAGGVPVTIRLDWAFPGETKDLVVRWRDGRELRADMLAGFPAFKSSLRHEYAGVVAHFADHVARGASDPAGPAATEWLERVLAAAERGSARA